jgi:DNA-binding transcriptional MerR regulator
MPIEINDETFYLIGEAMQEIKITSMTYYRWVKQRKINDVERRDRRGWRLFTKADIQRIKNFKNKTIQINQ